MFLPRMEIGSPDILRPSVTGQKDATKAKALGSMAPVNASSHPVLLFRSSFSSSPVSPLPPS